MAGAPEKAVDISRAMIMDPVPAADWLVITPIIIAIIGGSVCLMNRKNTALQPWLGLSFLSLLVLSNIFLFRHVLDNGVVTMSGNPSGGTYSGTGITDINAGTFDPTVAGAGTHTITYSFSDGNGCMNTFSTDIVVDTLPSLLLFW